MENSNRTPAWFWIITVIALLWNLMGVASFYMHAFITDEALAVLPEAERELYGQYPTWAYVVFAIAVLSGFLGSIGLILRKEWCRFFFIISLIAIVIQMYHSLVITDSMEVYGPGAAVMPILVILIAAFLVWFARRCSKLGIIS